MAQPFLHDLVTCLRAPTVVLSDRDGQVRADGAQGLLHGDTRFLSELVVTVEGQEPSPIGFQLRGGARGRFVGAVADVGDPIPDPTVRVERERHVVVGGLRETVAVVNGSRRRVAVRLAVRAGADMAAVADVKCGHPTVGLPPRPGDVIRWSAGTGATELRAVSEVPDGGAPDVELAEGHVTLTWQLDVPADSRAVVALDVRAVDARPSAGFLPAPSPTWTAELAVTSYHPHLAPLVRRSLVDLDALLLVDPAGPADVFVAAGSPWYLTLFGRDSIWTARFALPLTTELAGGTLRVLARRQAR
nr:amylo-alpha-1,6-glucosidase [Acidimicrobiia bacterium]